MKIQRVHGIIANTQGSGMYRFIIPNQFLSMRPDYAGSFSLFPPDPGVASLYNRIVFQLSHHDYQFHEVKRYRTHICKDDFEMLYEMDDLYTHIPQDMSERGKIPRNQLRERRRFLSLMDGIVVSTHALKEVLLEEKLTDLEIRVAENGLLPRPFRTPSAKGDKPRIGFYGLTSHAKDLEVIVPIVLDTHNKYHWIFLGYCPPQIKDKVEHVEEIPDFMTYLGRLSSLHLDLVLAPLEDTLFNSCKSPIKIMEAAYTGAAVIASRNEVFKGFPITYVKHRTRDFQKAIEDLLADDDERIRQAKALQEYVRQNHMIEFRQEQFEYAWKIPKEIKEFKYPSGIIIDHSAQIDPSSRPQIPIFIPALPSDPYAHLLFERLQQLGLCPQLLEDDSDPPEGFSKTVNHGVKKYFENNPETDFILLNSDTNPDPNFVDVLCRDAKNTPDAGTITPLSNHATLATYPFPLISTETVRQTPWKDLKSPLLEVPTGNGFCIWISQAAWKEFGPFDTETFPNGYGEETLFCQQIRPKYRNYLTRNTYVEHLGSMSYGNSDRSRLEQKAFQSITQKFPQYAQEVGFIGQKLLKWHEDTDRRLLGENNKILFVTNRRGGGSEVWLNLAREYLCGKTSRTALTLRPHQQKKGFYSIDEILHDHPLPPVPDLRLFCEKENIVLIVVSQLIDYPLEFATAIRTSGVPYHIYLHDFYYCCPRITFFDHHNEFCGYQKDPLVCNACIAGNPPSVFPPDIRIFRDTWKLFLSGAEKITAPSENTAAIFKNYYPDLQIVIDSTIWERYASGKSYPCKREAIQTRKVAVLGAIGAPYKGSEVLRAAMKLPEHPEIHVYGIFQHPRSIPRDAHVIFHGDYEKETLRSQLERDGISEIWLPMDWDETWSFVLSDAIATGIPIKCMKKGAMAERKTPQITYVEEFTWADSSR
jgi:hypothetical protein